MCEAHAVVLALVVAAVFAVVVAGDVAVAVRDAVRHFLRRARPPLAGMHFNLPLHGWLASAHAAHLW